MAEKSVVKGCTLFWGMALKVLAVVGLCAGVSMAKYLLGPTKTQPITITQSYNGVSQYYWFGIDTVPANKIRQLKSAYLTSILEENLHCGYLVSRTDVPKTIFHFDVYRRTDSSSYFKIVAGVNEYLTLYTQELYGYGRLSTANISYSKGVTYENDKIGELWLTQKGEAEVLKQPPYVRYLYGKFDSKDDEENRTHVHELITLLKENNVMHARLMFARDGIVYVDQNGKKADYAEYYCNTNDPYREGCRREMMLEYIDVDLHYADGIIALDSNQSSTTENMYRSDSMKIYAKMKGDKRVGYKLQFSHDNSNQWFWANAFNKSFSVEESVKGVNHTITIPADVFAEWSKNASNWMSFRLAIFSYDENYNVIDTTYTGIVNARIYNKISVVSSTKGFDYELRTTGEKYIVKSKNSQFADGDSVNVLAVAPSGYKFKCWGEDSGSNRCGSNANPLTVEVHSDSTFRAVYERVSNDIQFYAYASKVGSDVYNSASESPNIVNMVAAAKGWANITVGIEAKEDLCPKNEKGVAKCTADLIIRKDGANQWDTLMNVVANSSNDYKRERSLSITTKTYSKLTESPSFEVKAVLKNAKGKILETSPIILNIYYRLRLEDCVDQKAQESLRYKDYCSAVLDDGSGNLQNIKFDSSPHDFPYGTSIKLHAQYIYAYDFRGWKLNSSFSDLYDSTNFATVDSVYEFIMDTNKIVSLALLSRNRDVVRIIPENNQMPYAGMTNWNIFVANETEGAGFDFAKDTAFYITKNGSSKKFAVNTLDSMFTPGDYTLVLRITRKEKSGLSKRDSLWRANTGPDAYFMDSNHWSWNTVKSDDNNMYPVYVYHYDFNVKDTSFAVKFLSWNEQSKDYDKEEMSDTLNFGQIPVAPEVECPASDSIWDVSCTWTPEIAAVTGDAEYKYIVTKTKKTYAVSFYSLNNETGEYDNLVETRKVEIGEMPTAPEVECPASDSIWNVSCAWTPEIVAVTGDAEYKYVVTKTKKTYAVSFYSLNNETDEYDHLVEKQDVVAGETPVAPEVKCPESNSQWAFSCDWAPEIVPATKDAVYNYVVSKVEVPKSSSSEVAPNSSSVASSSSVVPPASSSSKVEDKSSSSKKDDPDAIADAARVPQFSLGTAHRSLQIAGARIGSAYAVFDMQGRVLMLGRVETANFKLLVNRSGTYLVRIGSQTKSVKVK